jgi:pSer/pThr/pTyr-binding forkhead associated (FHA) protein/tetratricopeptide (TPR) repeat protein
MATLKVFYNGELISDIEVAEEQTYTLGRSAENDIVLDDSAISRKHISVNYGQSRWHVELLSKFGKLQHKGEDVKEVTIEGSSELHAPPFTIKLVDEIEVKKDSDVAFASADMAVHSQDSFKNEEEIPAKEGPEDVALEESSEDINEFAPQEDDFNALQEVGEEEFEEESEDRTQVGALVDLGVHPYLRIESPDEIEEIVLRLEGQGWIIGRSEDCEVQINDVRSSREQFEIVLEKGQFQIRDLGSANGTTVNGHDLGEDWLSLMSGDEITVGSTKLTFEVRNPNLNKQLQTVPADVLNPPAVVSKGGALGAPLAYDASSPGAVKITPLKKVKKGGGKVFIRGLIIILAAVGMGGYLYQEEMKKAQKIEAASKAKEKDPNDPFAALDPATVEFIINTYEVANRYYVEGKYELALHEVQKIHEIIPEYIDQYGSSSKKLEMFCQKAIADANEMKHIEEVRKREEAAKKKADATIKKCESLAKKRVSSIVLEECLAPAMEWDPSDPRIDAIITAAKNREEDAKLKKQRQAAYLKKVQKGKALYRQAENLHRKNQRYKAIDAYNRHIASTYPDPLGLKKKSQSAIDTINGSIDSDIDKSLSLARALYAENKKADAVLEIDKALELDTTHADAITLKNQIIKELAKEAKALYADSVIEENIGNIEAAKEKWRKIVSRDIPYGDYYVKAKSKLKKYGEQ